jgi:PIN domain nuclease of toxin-antitoxin system
LEQGHGAGFLIHLDTHVLLWVYKRRFGRLSNQAKRLIEREACQVSPMVRLEVEMLFESDRTPEDAAAVLSELSSRIDLSVSGTSFDALVDRGLAFAWTRDPFDRLIVANAMADGVRLVTADELILANFPDAVW